MEDTPNLLHHHRVAAPALRFAQKHATSSDSVAEPGRLRQSREPPPSIILSSPVAQPAAARHWRHLFLDALDAIPAVGE